MIAFVDHQIGRLDVAVHDLLFVRVVQAPQHLNCIAGGFFVRQASFLAQDPRQGRTVDELHGQVVFVSYLEKLPDLGDIRMIELRLRLGFLAEPLQHARVIGHLRPQTLERHFAVQLRVHRVVHRAHPTLAEGMVDLVIFDVPAHSDATDISDVAPLGGFATARLNFIKSYRLIAVLILRPFPLIWLVTLP